MIFLLNTALNETTYLKLQVCRPQSKKGSAPLQHSLRGMAVHLKSP